MTKEFENYVQLNGPCGVRIELDASQLRINQVNDWDGSIDWEGCPALVYYKGCDASFHCALDTGDVDYEELSRTAHDWLWRKVDIVNDFIGYHHRRIAAAEGIPYVECCY